MRISQGSAFERALDVLQGTLEPRDGRRRCDANGRSGPMRNRSSAARPRGSSYQGRSDVQSFALQFR